MNMPWIRNYGASIPQEIDADAYPSVVALFDAAVERMVRSRLAEAFPDDAFLGEEEGGEVGERVWVVDPIDGTANFVRGVPRFCVSLAFVADGKVQLGAIVSPATGELYLARRGHGATLNGVPLKVGEMTMGDYLRPLGLRTALVGKTHMRADTEGMQRLGIDPGSIIGVRVAECGFDPYERDDGLHGVGPDGRYDPQLPAYNRYLNDQGYAGDNPWHDWANAAAGEGNRLASGWAMRNAAKPARVAEQDAETPYTTRRAIDFREGEKIQGAALKALIKAAVAFNKAKARK